jgi:hypothetical protein
MTACTRPMTAARRKRLAGLLVKGVVFVLLFVVPAAATGVAFAASASPTPTEDEPLVNWTWLAVGLGGVIIMILIMFFLTRVFRRRQEDE